MEGWHWEVLGFGMAWTPGRSWHVEAQGCSLGKLGDPWINAQQRAGAVGDRDGSFNPSPPWGLC